VAIGRRHGDAAPKLLASSVGTVVSLSGGTFPQHSIGVSTFTHKVPPKGRLPVITRVWGTRVGDRIVHTNHDRI